MEKPNATANRHVLPAVFVAMIALAHFFFSVLYELPYSIDSMSLFVPGIDDVTKYPNFSVMMMGAHYLGVFLILIPFLIRLTVPSPPPLTPFRIGKYFVFGHIPAPRTTEEDPHTETINHNRRFVMTLLVSFSALAIFFYYIFSRDERTDTPLIWAFMLCAVTMGFGATIVCNELVDAVFRLLKYLKSKLTTKLLNTL